MRAISLSATAGDDRAPRQQVLAAVDLGRLRQDRGAAVAHQPVDRRAERRVGADARVAVGAAALQADRDVARAAPARAARGSLPRAATATSSMPCATVFVVPPVSWMLKVWNCVPVARLSCSIRPEIWFVSQPRPTTRIDAKFGAARSRRACAAAPAAARRRCRSRSRRRASARSRRRRSGSVRERLGMDVAAEVVGDRARHRRRAVHRGQDADVVARRDAAVGAHDARRRWPASST